MKEFTQTELFPRGNCWQTAVACLLEIEPDRLPSQFDAYTFKDPGDGNPRWRLWYSNTLQAYLKKHHNLAYVEFTYPEEAFQQFKISGYHLMTGITERSASYGGERHVVVGKDGECVWDPHPSHTGLIGEIHLAVLAPWPKVWTWQDDKEPCLCPACKT